jgi:5-methylthioribose kinase
MTVQPWLLDPSNRLEIERYLVERRLVSAEALPIAIERAGAGNMNLALRVTPSAGRSFILKQGRPWVEKYPQIPAPFERTLVEAAFYAEIGREPRVASVMPAVLYMDADNHVLALEDVGGAGDFTSIYADGAIPATTVGALLDWLTQLASVAIPAERREALENRDMRALNHEHMFSLPLREGNGLDLDVVTPGLADAARALAEDHAYVKAVAGIGRRYLADGATLVHGDYFPGSWLKAHDGVRIIDPEFCFLGEPEVDCGILAAHLTLARCAPAALEMVAASAAKRGLDLALVEAYAGVEIMRRLIGVAQLPLAQGIDQKRSLLQHSRRLMLEPDKGLAW